MSPAMSWRSFLLGAFASFLITVDAKPITGNETTEITPNPDISSAFPPYMTKYGTLGVHYDFDAKLMMPFITCQNYSQNECAEKNRADCVRQVKCYPKTRTEQLGCMTVMSFNNIPDSSPTQYVQGCWVQGNQGGETCSSDASCYSRRLQPNSPNIVFCCCQTHMCNAISSNDLTPAEAQTTTPKPVMPRTSASTTDSTVYSDEDMLIAVCVVVFLLAVCVFSCLYSYCKREYYTIKVEWHDNWVEHEYETVNENSDEKLPRIILTT